VAERVRREGGHSTLRGRCGAAVGAIVAPPRSRLLGVAVATLLVGLVPSPSATAQPAEDGFYTIAPCRLVDTRGPAGSLGGPELVAAEPRFFRVVGGCGVPDSAVAVAVNATVVGPTAAGHLRLFGAGTATNTSTLNYRPGQTRANNAVVAIGQGGFVGAYLHQASGTAHLVIDVTGYFATSGCAPAQRLPSPLLAFRGDTRSLSWDPVPGATSYDLYVRAEPGSCGLLHDVLVTRDDQKVPGVTSPHDVSGLNACDTCYFVDMVAVGACDSPLESDLGRPAPLGFSLLPCVP
jgi:hypothetical protein